MECWAIITDFQRMQISLSCFISSSDPVTWNPIFCTTPQNFDREWLNMDHRMFLHTNSLLLILFFFQWLGPTCLLTLMELSNVWVYGLCMRFFQFETNTLFTMVSKNPSNVPWVCVRSRDHGEKLSVWANFKSAQKLNRKCYNLWLSPCTPFRLDTSCCISAFHLWNLILSLSHLKP